MSDTPTTETLNAEDDWAAALAEQEATTQQTDNAENETLSDPGTDTNQSTSSNTGDEEYPQEENFIGAKKHRPLFSRNSQLKTLSRTRSTTST